MNWSELARRHGVVQKNGGQMVKEFLQACNIPAACRTDVKRAPRRRKKKILGGITMPMKKPSAFYKNKLSEEIEKGVILIGEEVVEKNSEYFKIDNGKAAADPGGGTLGARAPPPPPPPPHI